MPRYLSSSGGHTPHLDIQALKQRLLIPEMWERLGLQGKPGDRATHLFGRTEIHRSQFTTEGGDGRTLPPEPEAT